MLKAAYVFDVDNPGTFAGKTVAMGFQNAFLDRGDDCRFFDVKKMNRGWAKTERRKLIEYAPDLLFTSVENIHLLPKRLNKNTKLVLWGQFYEPCDYELQTHCISPHTKALLQRLAYKFDVLVWSQHDDTINERFFLGYEKDLGVKFVQLLHAADHTKYVAPSDESPKYDFMWIGNIGHRKAAYESFIEPLKKQTTNYLDFHEYKRVDPRIVEFNKLYRKSLIIPNIHTPAQVKHRILLNERVFATAMHGGFQLCDTPLAGKYFSSEELIIAQTPDEFLEKFIYFKNNPDERLPYIQKMQDNILKNHTYENRITNIFNAFNIPPNRSSRLERKKSSSACE